MISVLCVYCSRRVFGKKGAENIRLLRAVQIMNTVLNRAFQEHVELYSVEFDHNLSGLTGCGPRYPLNPGSAEKHLRLELELPLHN